MGNIQGRLGLLGAQHGVQDSPRELRSMFTFQLEPQVVNWETPFPKTRLLAISSPALPLPQYLLFPCQGDKNVIPYPDWECELDRAWTPFPMCHSHTMEIHCICRARCRSQISRFLEQRLFPTLWQTSDLPSLPLLFQAAGVSHTPPFASRVLP